MCAEGAKRTFSRGLHAEVYARSRISRVKIHKLHPGTQRKTECQNSTLAGNSRSCALGGALHASAKDGRKLFTFAHWMRASFSRPAWGPRAGIRGMRRCLDPYTLLSYKSSSWLLRAHT